MIFLDTSFYTALVNSSDKFYDRTIELLKEIKNGIYGTPYTSIYVMAESAVLTAVRTHKNQDAIEGIRSFFVGDKILASVLYSNEQIDKSSWDLFCKVNTPGPNQPMSFVDCSNIIFAQHYHIGMIISFDAHFEGWLKQIK